MKWKFTVLYFVIVLYGVALFAAELPDIRSIRPDLITPLMTDGYPSPGKRVKQTASQYNGTKVYHSLYLPVDWRKAKKYPVIVEYAGNGPYKNNYGDICTGKVEDCNLGYGISGGRGFIWICLPYISQDHTHNQLQWWGDAEATVNYCKQVVPDICQKYGGDSSKVFLTGFSRGAIACDFIGLYDNEIASMWCGFVCHSHYDGVRNWNYEGSDSASAIIRLKRLKSKPQFISHEISVDDTKRYLNKVYPNGLFTFLSLPYRNHTDLWVLRDIPERKMLRDWIHAVCLSQLSSQQVDGKQN